MMRVAMITDLGWRVDGMNRDRGDQDDGMNLEVGYLYYLWRPREYRRLRPVQRIAAMTAERLTFKSQPRNVLDAVNYNRM